MFELIGSYVQSKAKAFVKDFFDSVDLDKNKVKDTEQWMGWIDTLGGLGKEVDDAIDQEKLSNAIKKGAGVVREIATYIEDAKEGLEDNKKK